MQEAVQLCKLDCKLEILLLCRGHHRLSFDHAQKRCCNAGKTLGAFQVPKGPEYQTITSEVKAATPALHYEIWKYCQSTSRISKRLAVPGKAGTVTLGILLGELLKLEATMPLVQNLQLTNMIGARLQTSDEALYCRPRELWLHSSLQPLNPSLGQLHSQHHSHSLQAATATACAA